MKTIDTPVQLVRHTKVQTVTVAISPIIIVVVIMLRIIRFEVDIDPADPSNIFFMDAFDETQALQQSCQEKDAAAENILSMLDTLDTFHISI